MVRVVLIEQLKSICFTGDITNAIDIRYWPSRADLALNFEEWMQVVRRRCPFLLRPFLTLMNVVAVPAICILWHTNLFCLNSVNIDIEAKLYLIMTEL